MVIEVCRVYSDISVRHGVTAYCLCIVPSEGPEIWETGRVNATSVSVIGELAATARAIAMAPTCNHLFVYTDLKWLVSVLNGTERISYYAKVKKQVNAVRDAAKRFDKVTYCTVNRKNPIYRKCDHHAYRWAGHIARQVGVIDKDGKAVPLRSKNLLG